MGRTKHEDDVALVARCREGDESAWGRLVDRYKSMVYSAALRTGLDNEGADDVFQQVWIEVHQSLHRIRDAQALPRWLVVTTRRIAYKHAAQRRVQVEGVLEEMVDPAELPSTELESLQRLQHLEALLADLSRTCQKLLRALFLDTAEPSYKEIAQSAGIAIGSIGPTRARCLAQLRRLMETSS